MQVDVNLREYDPEGLRDELIEWFSEELNTSRVVEACRVMLSAYGVSDADGKECFTFFCAFKLLEEVFKEPPAVLLKVLSNPKASSLLAEGFAADLTYVLRGCFEKNL